MTTAVDRQSEKPRTYRVVGTRPIRHDGLEKVTGAAKYGADIQLAGMLHGKILRSPHAHAYIRSIDTSKAEALPGVAAVTTSLDFPIIDDEVIDFAVVGGGPRVMAELVMARDKVLYKGHALAAVAAVNPYIAEQAVRLIEVEYEVLPTALTLHDAIKEDAPILHDNLTTRFRVERFARGEDTGVKGNIASHLQHKLGDIEKGFAEADVIVEREFDTETVHQAGIPQIKPTFLEIAPSGIPSNIIPHSKGVKCGLIRSNPPFSYSNHRPAKPKIPKPLVYAQVSPLGTSFATP